MSCYTSCLDLTLAPCSFGYLAGLIRCSSSPLEVSVGHSMGHWNWVTSCSWANHCQNQDIVWGICGSVDFKFRFTHAFISYDHLSQIMAQLLSYNQSLWIVFDPAKWVVSILEHSYWKEYFPWSSSPNLEYQRSSYWNCSSTGSKSSPRADYCLQMANKAVLCSCRS